MKVPFNKTNITQLELNLVKKVLLNEKLEGGGSFSKSCSKYIQSNYKIKDCLLTSSCTSALEMIALVLNLQPGDEVIMPSYTFVSTANAFVLRGCKPVFVDVRREDLNLDIDLAEKAITKKTKALVLVHYGGVACDMKKALKLSKKYNIALIEDAAQAIGASYNNKFLGSFGDMGAYSFHGTKNISCGEGGALLINKKKYLKRAQILYEKGTNRLDFARGKVSKYNWRDLGSSFILSNYASALLLGQLKREREISRLRLEIWSNYYNFFSSLKDLGSKYRIVTIPPYAKHNGHLFFLIFSSKNLANKFSSYMRSMGYEVSKHYEPLHSSPYGLKTGRVVGRLGETEKAANCLVRLPLWPGIKVDSLLESSSRIINKL